MGMAFMAMAIYFLWSFERKNNWWYALMSVFSVFGLLYAIPSNIYFVLSVGIIYFISWIIEGRKLSNKEDSNSFLDNWIKRGNFYVMVLIGLGAAFAF